MEFVDDSMWLKMNHEGWESVNFCKTRKKYQKKKHSQAEIEGARIANIGDVVKESEEKRTGSDRLFISLQSETNEGERVLRNERELQQIYP